MSDKFPKITVVTPSFNQGRYIEETILSIVTQGYPNLEYFIIDGGSTDNTLEIIKKHESKIDYWISEKDNGQTDAINKGFKRATGEIVCWINSDDILVPGSLHKIGSAFANDHEVKVVMGWTVRIDKKSCILFNHFIPKQTFWFAKHGVFYFAQQSWFWKREMFDYLGYLDESLHACMDIEFLIRQIASKAKIKHLPDILAGFRQHEETKTFENGTIWTADRLKLAEKYKAFKYDHPDTFARILYGFLKVFNLYYLRQFLFQKKWAGKPIDQLYKNK